MRPAKVASLEQARRDAIIAAWSEHNRFGFMRFTDFRKLCDEGKVEGLAPRDWTESQAEPVERSETAGQR